MQQLGRDDVVDDRYAIVEELGRGGFGTVYKARHIKLDKDVALKTLNLEHAEITASRRPEFFSRFRNEARSLTQLRHGSIINVMDFGIVGDTTPFLVMDYFPGQPLLKWGEAHRPTVDQWLAVFRQIFEALGHAHDIRVVHRDIKSANVLVSGTPTSPRVMLIDWGIAYSMGGTRITSFGGVVGTTGAVDPENYCDPAAEYVPESDFFAAGALLYEALCGREPFATSIDMTEAQRRAVIVSNQIVPPTELIPDMSPSLEDFLLSLLATERKHRPPCAAACIELVDALIRGEPFLVDDVLERHRAALRAQPAATPASLTPAGSDEEKQRVAAMIAEFEAVKSRPSSVKRMEQLEAVKSQQSEGKKTVSLHGPVEPQAVDAQDLPAASAADAPRDPIAAVDNAASRYGYRTEPEEKPWHRHKKAIFTALVVAVLGAVYVAKKDARPSHQAEPPVAPTVFRAEDLEPKKDESALAKFASPNTTAPVNTASLSTFSPDIKAQYPATIGGSLPPSPVAAPQPGRVGGRHDNSKDETFDRTMKPVGGGADRRDELATPTAALPIPHNTTAGVRLLEELDTSNDEPIRAELRSSLVIKGELVLPAGSILSGRASLRYNRAQARFDLVTLPDGAEHRIVAIAITGDGREGIDGGRLEFGEPPPDKTGEKVGRAVGAVASEAINLIPGGDAITRTAQTVAGNEVREATTTQADVQRSRNRIIVPRKHALTVKFQLK